jgi:tRNA (guanosine-2'-O-)-methyltransferase
MSLTNQERQLIKHFSQYVSDHKKEFIEKVLSQRTRHVTVVLEDIYQSQNASAVVRTCECMGLQDIHIIENTSTYQVNTRVLKGSNKWMDLIRYRKKGIDNTEACFQQLKKQGYTIYAADPSEDGVSIHDLDVNAGKIAIMFGNELRGVSNNALELCDYKVKIPMYGFTESLNISVSVAICLNTLVAKMHQNSWEKHGLTIEEKEELTLQWYRNVVRKSDLIEREFLRTIQ